MVFSVCLFLWVIGVLTGFFEAPVFSAFYWLSKELARIIAYVVLAVGIVLLFAIPALSRRSKTKTEETPLVVEEQITPPEEQQSVEIDEFEKLVNSCLEVIDISFDILRGLNASPIDWQRFKGYFQDRGVHLQLSGKETPTFTIDYSKVIKAIHKKDSRKTATEVFNILAVVHNYFDSSGFNELLIKNHPNFRQTKDMVLGYLMLNARWLGKVVKDKDPKEEKVALKRKLEDLTRSNNSKINFTELQNSLDNVLLSDIETEINNSRSTYRDKVKQFLKILLPKDNIDLEQDSEKKSSNSRLN